MRDIDLRQGPLHRLQYQIHLRSQFLRKIAPTGGIGLYPGQVMRSQYIFQCVLNFLTSEPEVL